MYTVTAFNERYFGICGLIISDSELAVLDARMNALKEKKYGSREKILHRSGGEGPVIKKVTRDTVNRMCDIISDLDFRCFCFMADKNDINSRASEDKIYHLLL